ncbi:HtaA domain-containing protein [Streptomyces pactum]|uniref:HtaA domain-containing protein n=1 Tax=Streptomyces pactum TaxID=68249 RepID=A0ABS0NH88_9ACTN|nr:HtaA domain-containing protein [Streptomyces pactum]MBH5334554.1 HtaA domain-containing protein [Streptomyces pactum]
MRRSRPARVFAVPLLTALAVAGLPAVAGARAADRAESAGRAAGADLAGGAVRAAGADRAVAGGRLDWGVKTSFQRYVTGPVAQGNWSLLDGAGTVGADRFRFHSATGTHDPDDGAFRAGFRGGVRFLGHREPDGSHQLDLTVSRPTVRIAGGRGTLHADIASRARGGGRLTSATQVPLAALDLTGVNLRGGGTAVVLRDIPARLTARGAQAFAGYYTAGTPLDPVSLSVDLTQVRDGARRTPAPGPSPDPAARPTGRPARGEVRDAVVDWGVRRTFREYVGGDIARGRWRLSEGARDGGAVFRFGAGRGTYDTARGTVRAGFAGRVHFTGRNLDLALSGVSVRVQDGRGTLSADVTTEGRTERDVPLVTFAAGRLRPADGLIAVTEAPTELTRRGAAAFGGMYRAGTAMDPLTLAVTTAEGARLPPLPDLGDAPSADAAPERRAADRTPAGPATGAAADTSGPSGPSGTVAVVAGGSVLLMAGATGVLLYRRRGRAAGGPPAGD